MPGIKQIIRTPFNTMGGRVELGAIVPDESFSIVEPYNKIYIRATDQGNSKFSFVDDTNLVPNPYFFNLVCDEGVAFSRQNTSRGYFSGNILTLLNQSGNPRYIPIFCFNDLFANCNLTEAPVNKHLYLPAVEYIGSCAYNFNADGPLTIHMSKSLKDFDTSGMGNNVTAIFDL